MDEADRSQAFADREAERILADARSRNAAAALSGGVRPALRVCVDCDDPIDARRLAAAPAAIRCTHCQGCAEQHDTRRRSGVIWP
ncbi:TraR/DksA C4-type zinc finger protein [Brevundimonas sp.]|uniref:TraR/DksA C4-type zinc finger protein n=1 Tax=Brevundimonas sp. TaxID=1871086 RepID=UPI003F7234DC